jgi:hypothetical protein
MPFCIPDKILRLVTDTAKIIKSAEIARIASADKGPSDKKIWDIHTKGNRAQRMIKRRILWYWI